MRNRRSSLPSAMASPRHVRASSTNSTGSPMASQSSNSDNFAVDFAPGPLGITMDTEDAGVDHGSFHRTTLTRVVVSSVSGQALELGVRPGDVVVVVGQHNALVGATAEDVVGWVKEAALAAKDASKGGSAQALPRTVVTVEFRRRVESVVAFADFEPKARKAGTGMFESMASLMRRVNERVVEEAWDVVSVETVKCPVPDSSVYEVRACSGVLIVLIVAMISSVVTSVATRVERPHRLITLRVRGRKVGYSST